MDLDQWISKVKEGQHLLEDELQLLCEYVRISSIFPNSRVLFYYLYRSLFPYTYIYFVCIFVLLGFMLLHFGLKVYVILQIKLCEASNIVCLWNLLNHLYFVNSRQYHPCAILSSFS